MNHPTNASSSYYETSINTSNPAKLVVMLYEGAIRFLRQSVDAIQIKDLARKRHSLDRAVAIVQHLQAILNVDEAQDLSRELNRLYIYILSRILEGSAKLDAEPLEEAIKLLSVLLSGWEEVARKEREHAVPAVLLAQQAFNQGFQLHG